MFPSPRSKFQTNQELSRLAYPPSLLNKWISLLLLTVGVWLDQSHNLAAALRWRGESSLSLCVALDELV